MSFTQLADRLNHEYEMGDYTRDVAQLIEAAQVMREALECVASNGEGRGMGWTPAQHSRIALAKADEICALNRKE